jgi:hypothetical protein
MYKEKQFLYEIIHAYLYDDFNIIKVVQYYQRYLCYMILRYI